MPQAQNGTPHLLIVEDNRPNRILVETYLRKFGFISTSVGDGVDAVKQVRNQLFDLVLMDIQMPKMDGLAATRRIRELPSPNGQTPILALTASERSEAEAACAEAGMNGIVCKPIVAADLHAKIILHINRS